jgi:hypothetical protein
MVVASGIGILYASATVAVLVAVTEGARRLGIRGFSVGGTFHDFQ